MDHSSTTASASCTFWVMYYRDLSPFQYESSLAEAARALNVGWLSPEQEFEVSDPAPHFIDALWTYCSHPIVEHRGFHTCELCAPLQNRPIRASHRGRSIDLGSKLICVFGSNATAYLSPDLVFHYVSEHRYRPPEDFVRAVISGPQPGTKEYAKLVRNYINSSSVTAAANDAARSVAARFGYFLDGNDIAVPMPDKAFDEYPELTLEELAIELRLKSY